MYPAVTNIGVRPTFGDARRTTIETHLLGVDRDLYGAAMRLGVRPAPAGRARVRRASSSCAPRLRPTRQRARSLFERMSL